MRRLFACAQLGNTTGWLGNRVPKAPRQATCPPAIKVRLPRIASRTFGSDG